LLHGGINRASIEPSEHHEVISKAKMSNRDFLTQWVVEKTTPGSYKAKLYH